MSTAAPLSTKLRSQSVRASLTTFGTGIFRSTGGSRRSDMTGRGGGGGIGSVERRRQRHPLGSGHLPAVGSAHR